jgi:Amt family ammonium transporter
LRVTPAWVGTAGPSVAGEHLLPVHEAVWIWSVRRYARGSLWALPAGAALYGWSTLGTAAPPGPLAFELAAGWFCAIAMIGLAGLLAGARTRRSALAGLLIALAGLSLLLPLSALPEGVGPDGVGLSAAQVQTASQVGAAVLGVGLLLLGWAVFRSKLVNPADGVLLMLAAATIGAGPYAVRPLPTVGALLLLAAGMGLAWTGSRLIPPA